MTTVGKIAPHFSCQSVLNNEIKSVDLDSFTDTYKLLFFYPLDFTFVCPTELHALQDHLESFIKRNVQVLGISVDSAYTHQAWLNTPKKNGGVFGIAYPLLADITKNIARSYGVLDEEAGVAMRGTFLIDRQNIIQHASINNLPLGRNISEILRIIDAIKHTEQNGEVCPANWNSGDKALKPSQDGLDTYFNPSTENTL